MLSECNAGILCHLSDHPGFRAVLKQRYSDFIVNEVDENGNVIYLTSLDAPVETDEHELKVPTDTCRSFSSEIDTFRSLASVSDAELLDVFIRGVISGGTDCVKPIILAPDSDKIHRTAIHRFFKENLKFLTTDTVDGPDASSKCIRVSLHSVSGRNDGNSRKRNASDSRPIDSRNLNSWPQGLGRFLRFHLYKENKDTQEALRLIGNMLGIQLRSFGFSGTKDKRAITTQLVTIFKQQADRLAVLNKRLIGIKVGNFSYVDKGLVLGQLQGNKFTIVLRGIVADSEEAVRSSVDSIAKNGFINYFGLQRFGSGSIPTHLIGATLLRGEWKNAVQMILDPRDGENDAVKKVREAFVTTGDVEETLRQLPRHLVAERAILQCLKRSPRNYLQALQSIPRTLRMMYVHSYQSYLWNHAASIRVQKYGTKVVSGDLVFAKHVDQKSNVEDMSIDSCFDDCDEFNDSSSGDTFEKYNLGNRNMVVKVVSSDDISSGRLTIDDIILPLPGSRVIYPHNDVAEVYNDLAKKDNINLTESAHAVKEFSIECLTGTYRHVFQKLIDFKWDLLKYSDETEELAETDLGKIMKAAPATETRVHPLGTSLSSPQTAISQPEHITDIEMEAEGGSQRATRTAMKLCFTLPASSYATMAIRELLKTSTAVAYHKSLTS